MQTVNFTKDYFDFIQKNTLLTLEQAQWFTQDEGFIPLPRKCNKKNEERTWWNNRWWI